VRGKILPGILGDAGKTILKKLSAFSAQLSAKPKEPRILAFVVADSENSFQLSAFSFQRNKRITVFAFVFADS
jgi:hypothetical protein